MLIDIKKYPELPPGAMMFQNPKTGYIQVFTQSRVKDPQTGKSRVVRVSLGKMVGETFVPSEQYQQRKEIERLKGEVTALKEALKSTNSITIDQEVTAGLAANGLTNAITSSRYDERTNSGCSQDIRSVALLSLMSALTGDSDAISVQKYSEMYGHELSLLLPDFSFENVSHDAVRRLMMLVNPERFNAFYLEMTEQIRNTPHPLRIIAADGQAVRATATTSPDKPDNHGARMLMSLFDTTTRVCIGQKLIDKKTNEIGVGYKMIEDWDLNGCVVTADAMSCQVCFVDAVINAGANYLLSLKGNQDASLKEVQHIFNHAHKDHIYSTENQTELGHGRIESRKFSMISGHFLSKPLRDKWLGLSLGAVVRMEKTVFVKKTRRESSEISFYITSIPASRDTVLLASQIVRAHWGIENNLHWILDMHWHQDRMQAKNPNYIANRSLLNKLALAFIEKYRLWLWETGRIKNLSDCSIRSVQQLCRKPHTALECIAVGLGAI